MSKNPLEPWFGPDGPEATIAMLTHYALQMGWDQLGFKIGSPTYKPEQDYMTSDGYPLGTTIWFMRVQLFGRMKYAFGESFCDCAWDANEMICQAIEAGEFNDDVR